MIFNILFSGSLVADEQSVNVYTQHHSNRFTLERASLGTLLVPTNRAWIAAFDQINIVFPYDYNFAECFEEVRSYIIYL